LLVGCEAHQEAVQAAQRFAHRDLQLLESVGMLCRIGLLVIQRFGAPLRLVPVLLENRQGLRELASVYGLANCVEFRSAELPHEFRSMDRVGIARKLGTKLG
jgi:hypothetical protein